MCRGVDFKLWCSAQTFLSSSVTEFPSVSGFADWWGKGRGDGSVNGACMHTLACCLCKWGCACTLTRHFRNSVLNGSKPSSGLWVGDPALWVLAFLIWIWIHLPKGFMQLNLCFISKMIFSFPSQSPIYYLFYLFVKFLCCPSHWCSEWYYYSWPRGIRGYEIATPLETSANIDYLNYLAFR